MVKDKTDKFPVWHWAVFVPTILWDITCWLIVLLIWAVSKDSILFWENGLWCGIGEGSFLRRGLFKGYGGGTIGHGGWMNIEHVGEKGVDGGVEFHEHVHVEQYEVVSVIALINSVVHYITGASICTVLIMQFLGGVMGWLSSVIVAKLRGEHGYHGSAHEESAYAREKKTGSVK